VKFGKGKGRRGSGNGSSSDPCAAHKDKTTYESEGAAILAGPVYPRRLFLPQCSKCKRWWVD